MWILHKQTQVQSFEFDVLQRFWWYYLDTFQLLFEPMVTMHSFPFGKWQTWKGFNLHMNNCWTLDLDQQNLSEFWILLVFLVFKRELKRIVFLHEGLQNEICDEVRTSFVPWIKVIITVFWKKIIYKIIFL